LGYKLGSHGIELVVTDESYTSKASFVDGDKMPKRYNPRASIKRTFSGKRVKRGLYKSSDEILLNADANGAYNILRKTDSDFSFSKLTEKVGARVKEWLHPTKRVRFWLEKKNDPEQKSNPKPCPDVRRVRRGDKGLILPSPQC
jgi:putative transposase